MPRKIEKTVYTFKELLDAAGDPESPVTSKAVQRAREWLQEVSTSYDWWDDTFETWKEALDQIGFENADISFRGFASQGDGASFTANVNLPKLIDFLATPREPGESITVMDGTGGSKEEFRPWLVHRAKGVGFNPKFRRLLVAVDLVEARVRRTGGFYVHEHTCEFEAEFNDPGKRNSEDWNESRYPSLRRIFDEFVKTAEELRLDLSRAIYQDLEEDYLARIEDDALVEDSEANGYVFDENGLPE